MATNQSAQGLAIIFTIIAGVIVIVAGLKKVSRKTSISTPITKKPEFYLDDIKPSWKIGDNEKVQFNANLKNIGDVLHMTLK